MFSNFKWVYGPEHVATEDGNYYIKVLTLIEYIQQMEMRFHYQI